jgi:hypothetical protein
MAKNRITALIGVTRNGGATRILIPEIRLVFLQHTKHTHLPDVYETI